MRHVRMIHRASIARVSTRAAVKAAGPRSRATTLLGRSDGRQGVERERVQGEAHLPSARHRNSGSRSKSRSLTVLAFSSCDRHNARLLILSALESTNVTSGPEAAFPPSRRAPALGLHVVSLNSRSRSYPSRSVDPSVALSVRMVVVGCVGCARVRSSSAPGLGDGAFDTWQNPV